MPSKLAKERDSVALDNQGVTKAIPRAWERIVPNQDFRGIGGRFARCARAVHKVCTRTYPTYIAVFSTNDNEPCCAFI